MVGGTGAVTATGGSGRGYFQGGTSGNNLLRAGTSAATLRGAGASDTLVGGAGNDSLIGSGSAASILGGAGDDIIAVGSGSETIAGGAGADTFRFAHLSSGTRTDVIADFNISADTLQLVGYNANEFATAIASAQLVRGNGLPYPADQPGGMQVTLSDNTKITFINLSRSDLGSVHVVS